MLYLMLCEGSIKYEFRIVIFIRVLVFFEKALQGWLLCPKRKEN